MSQLIDIKVPDIGDFTEVPVIEVFVKPGDVIKLDDALVTLESDKATMDVPASAAGTVREVLVKLGDKIGEGTVVVRVEASHLPAAAPVTAPSLVAASEDLPAMAASTEGGMIDVRVPDIGDFSEVPVIEVFVKPGDIVKVDDALVTLESDKATMDVPSSAAGTVKEVLVKLGDKVGEGSVIVRLAGNVVTSNTQPAAPAPTAVPTPEANEHTQATPVSALASNDVGVAALPSIPLGSVVHASHRRWRCRSCESPGIPRAEWGGPSGRHLRETGARGGCAHLQSASPHDCLPPGLPSSPRPTCRL